MSDSGYTRRRLLLRGSRLTLAGATALPLLWPAGARAVDWEALFSRRMPEGRGRVKVLEGRAFANRQPLRVGDPVPSGSEVSVSEGGRAVITLEDGSIFTVYGGSSLELILTTMREGIFNLLRGAVLAVFSTGTQYLSMGPTAAVGIKGTVVYRQVFGPDDRFGRTMDGRIEIPAGVPDYFCTCNGEVAYRRDMDANPFRSVRATHHSAFFLDPAMPEMLRPAPMMNHTDEEIRALIDLQEGPKHDTGWLQ